MIHTLVSCIPRTHTHKIILYSSLSLSFSLVRTHSLTHPHPTICLACSRAHAHTLSLLNTPFSPFFETKGKHKYSRHTNNQISFSLSRPPSLSRARALSLSCFTYSSHTLTTSPHTLFPSRADAHAYKHTLSSLSLSSII